jgi:hypothetical protein
VVVVRQSVDANAEDAQRISVLTSIRRSEDVIAHTSDGIDTRQPASFNGERQRDIVGVPIDVERRRSERHGNARDLASVEMMIDQHVIAQLVERLARIDLNLAARNDDGCRLLIATAIATAIAIAIAITHDRPQPRASDRRSSVRADLPR